MIEKYYNGVIPAYEGEVTALDAELKAAAEKSIVAYEALNDGLKVTEAYQEVMDLISKANKYIQDSEPWTLAKDPSKAKELASCMYHLANVIYISGMLMSPILVESAPKIFDQLGIPEELRSYEAIKKFGNLGGLTVKKGEQLFPRLKEADEIAYIAGLMAAPKEKAAA